MLTIYLSTTFKTVLIILIATFGILGLAAKRKPTGAVMLGTKWTTWSRIGVAGFFICTIAYLGSQGVETVGAIRESIRIARNNAAATAALKSMDANPTKLPPPHKKVLGLTTKSNPNDRSKPR